MAGRHQKRTVEYFPHNVNHGRIMYVLESRWGNDGYAAFYKLLELLGDCEGHYYRAGNASEKAFLYARMSVKPDIGEGVIDALLELDVVDKSLWFNHQVIWMQEFVNSLEAVYGKREAKKPPPKPHVIPPPDMSLPDISLPDITIPVPGNTVIRPLPALKERKDKVKEHTETVLFEDLSSRTEEDPDIPIPDEQSKYPPCPHQAIVALYNQILGPYLPPVIIKSWKNGRERGLAARWREDEARQNLEFWQRYFTYIRDGNPFLLGKGAKGFRADLEWLVLRSKFSRIVEGIYCEDGRAMAAWTQPEPKPVPEQSNSSWTICPNCKKEVLKSDREGDKCLHCVERKPISDILKGIGKPIPP